MCFMNCGSSFFTVASGSSGMGTSFLKSRAIIHPGRGSGIVEARYGDPAGPVEEDSLELEQSPLHRRAALEAPGTAVRAHGPVAGYDDRERVRCERMADGPGGVPFPEMS